MTLSNIIGVCLTVVIVTAGIIIKIKAGKKIKELDGFCGIINKEEESE